MKRVLALLATSLALATAAEFDLAAWGQQPADAQAHWFKPGRNLAARSGTSYWKAQHWHATTTLRFLKNHPQAGTRHSRAIVRRNHTWLLHVANEHLLPAWPPHHLLWLCIHGGEGNWDDPNSGNNGHYGGLQMYPGWLGYFSGTANNYSQLQQEWFAERGYRDSGYSSRWLNGQWGQTIGSCWRYA